MGVKQSYHSQFHAQAILFRCKAGVDWAFTRANGRIQEAACWAHVRRKFYDLQQAHASPVASEALQRIVPCMGSRKTYADGRPMSAENFATNEPGSCLSLCGSGSRRRF
jgi:hypothetical protein